MDNLYENIGGKIKQLAKWTFVTEAVISVIAGFAMLFEGEVVEPFVALLVIVLGPIIAFVSTWLLYGFGEIIDKLTSIEMNTRSRSIESVQPNQNSERNAHIAKSQAVIEPKSTERQPVETTSKPFAEQKPKVKLEPISQAEIDAGYWQCECGTKNKTIMCMNCGNSKK